MLCPFCNYDNIPGVDTCEQCLMDLQAVDRPRPSTAMERGLIRNPVSDLGPKEAVTVAPGTSIRDAIEVMAEKNIGSVLVGADGRVDGIFSERDVLLKVASKMAEIADQPVDRVMTRSPESVEVSTSLAFSLRVMCQGDFRHLPLTEKGRLRGIVSLRDFLGLVFHWYPDLAESET